VTARVDGNGDRISSIYLALATVLAVVRQFMKRTPDELLTKCEEHSPDLKF
jgi:hypothetical protein